MTYDQWKTTPPDARPEEPQMTPKEEAQEWFDDWYADWLVAFDGWVEAMSEKCSTNLSGGRATT